VRAVRELCGPDWAPSEILIPRREPADAGPYRNFFRAPARFNEETAAVVFPTGLLSWRLPTANALARTTIEQQLMELDLKLKELSLMTDRAARAPQLAAQQRDYTPQLKELADAIEEVRQASLLWVVQTGDPYRLSRQWTRGRASTGDTGEARAELIDGPRRKNVGVRKSQIPVLEVTKCRKPWDCCA